jgi:hypothetical protein
MDDFVYTRRVFVIEQQQCLNKKIAALGSDADSFFQSAFKVALQAYAVHPFGQGVDEVLTWGVGDIHCLQATVLVGS